ncbi:TCP-1/cpn60 chaperonin family protein [Paenibacillus chibensis]|uniref:TCP-1/cpn60 chaperonin family protein n=1 Tax=Paenibacillus chibensis TaxID=59846 RepID=UPI000FDBECDB|nr:TCP-1/cpn60 chaperonin family protein [Paenibacillus chibensis]MEC0369871.1 TCP-1/cpn60 chaperonin family protein [Paenibacillus chibensis]
MSQGQQPVREGEERYAALLNNSNAVRAITSAVEGTLGPKGLDVMLVGDRGEVIITNDGVTILDKMDVSHPAARLLIQVARSQQKKVGDGTTTATVLAGALVQEGVSQIVRGVPASKVVAGMQQGIKMACDSLRSRAKDIRDLNDPLLAKAVYVAGREREEIVSLVMEAAAIIGIRKLQDPSYLLADAVTAHEKGNHEVFEGLLLRQMPLYPHDAPVLEDTRILILHDALEPESLDEEVLTTEAGFARYMDLRERFARDLQGLAELGVGLVLLEKGIHPDAEQFCMDHGMMVIPRVSRSDLARVSAMTGAVPLRRTALHKEREPLRRLLGFTPRACYDETLERVRISSGAQKEDPFVTLIVGASTAEVVGESARIAADAASALQAAIAGGILPGGGTAELAVSYELERSREAVKGMEAFGIAAVAAALRKPMSQILLNAGYNPLEKMEEARAAQLSEGCDDMGVDCDTGFVIHYEDRGIVDPAWVKIHGLQTAGEVAAAVLRIHNVIKMRSAHRSED